MLRLRLSRRLLDLRREDGIALVVALGVLLVLTVTTVTAVQMATGSQQTISLSQGGQTAYANAQGGINNVESMLNYDVANNINPSTPTNFGCGTGTSGASNCTTYTPTAFCLQTTTCTAGTAGTASVYGWFSGTNAGTFDNQSVAASTWLIVSTGYAKGASATTLSRTRTATITVSAANAGTVAAVWNYVYSTAPSDGNPNTCEVTLNADHDSISAPMYITGDLCLSGDHATVKQDTSEGGQPVDLRVGGGITLTGAHSTIGCDPAKTWGTCPDTNNSIPINSAYSALGCRETTNGPFHPCSSSTDHYYVSQTDTPLTITAPTTDFPDWYTNSSPGPSHTCTSALTSAPNLMTTFPHAFDNDATMNGTNTTFVLTPTNADYNCVTSTGTLDWNHTTHLLTINGTIFFDGNVSLADSAAAYSGKATIYVNGVFTFGGAGLTANCPVNGNPAQCGINAGTWNPNTNMLVLVANKSSGTAIDISSDNSKFQGDLMCPSTSTVAIAGDHTSVEGGIICGNFSFGDHTLIYPLPTITSLPAGAPVPPNVGATVSSPNYTS